MLHAEQYQRVSQMLPWLQRAEPEARRELQAAAFVVQIPVGHDVFAEGDQVEAIALLIAGVVRVYKIGASGREITLYRVGLGQSCILSANAILSQNTFPAIATVEQAAEAVMIPAALFRDWVNRYEPWRTFVFDLLSQRLASVMEVVDEVAFQRMDVRVASLLLMHVQQANPIHITHQGIAAELGSSREVISRLLEDFAQRGLVRVSRGLVEVLDLPRLKTLAAV